MGAEARLRTDSPAATEELAAELGARARAGLVIALEGDLGSGKTTFVRGLARGLGSDDPVSSPTYTLMHEYLGRLPLYHFDAWMESREKAYLQEGGSVFLCGDGVAVVEWADRVADELPSPRLAIELAHVGPEQRELRLRVEGRDADLEGWVASLAARGAGPLPGAE